MQLDVIDRRILRTLQAEGNLPNNVLAERVGLTPAPCLRRVQRLRQEGIIDRYLVALDNKAIGYSVSAYAEITLNHHIPALAEKFIEKVKTKPEVLACHVVAGDFDFLLRLVAKDMQDYQRIIWDLHAIEGIRQMRSIIVMNTLKDEINPSL
ncbi:Lrp/AsnC family transcriptional regulator [Leeia sp. TBRC 13508]|uniref:Lrp/AsnC family transcriptional regulator n=1 Tax=Leeia speluncae TaxID=2884804 RepID=A0ABS8D3J0_9NEIS|nr:Lrp/AsnC family transcriptional regulator [Leeia speluncae]MCB6182776.1 Lrp/AsnC family transcriptional regulator [Leeia speluncae]